MCNTTVKVCVPTADGWREQDIDQCISSMVGTLNQVGIFTASCCCGHGKELGHIWLKDGRVLVILPYDATKVEVDNIVHLWKFSTGEDDER